METNMTLPLTENDIIKELLSILKENRAPGMQDLLDVLTHVAEIERQFGEALGELQVIRQELSAARKQSHPAVKAMQDTARAVETNVSTLWEQLNALRQSIIDGCRNAVAAFKEKGITALDHVTRFFKIKPVLESMQDSLAKTVQTEDKAIATIETVSAEYHQAGRHTKNIFRAVAGKEVSQDVRPAGKLAQALQAPFQRLRSIHVAMKDTAERAIGKLGELEKAAERKPSVEKTMRAYRDQTQKAPKTQKKNKTRATPAVRRDAR